MALPLKSGADLYNHQLIRAAIWNYSADGLDPKEYATGLMYFNTNPSSNMFQKLRFRTATDWKTIAFAEDLDVATNKDFVALKTKVEAFLEGDVDSDGVLENLKEIQKFLDNYSSATDLTDILNTKLDKTGGTITHSGNNGLKLSSSDGSANYLWFEGIVNSSQNLLGGLGMRGYNDPVYVSPTGLTYPLLHSGNVGDYAVKIDGSSRMKAEKGLKWDSSEGGNSDNFDSSFFVGRDASDGSALAISKRPYTAVLNVGGTAVGGYRFQLASYVGPTYNELYYRGYNNNGSEWKDWKTIAFTDSNVASATKLATPRKLWGNDFDGTGNVNGHLYLPNNKAIYSYDTSGVDRQLLIFTNDLYIGWGVSEASRNTILLGNNIYFRYGTTPTTGFILNSSGNLTIGSSDLAGTDYKLVVDGLSRFKNNVESDGNIIGAGAVQAKTSAHGFISLQVGSTGNKGLLDSRTSWILYTDGTNTLLPRGNVGIGISNPEYKLHVIGNTFMSGFVIGAKFFTKENYGLWRGNSYSASLADTDVAYNATKHIFAGGNIGIGTTDPKAKLHVSQDIVANGTIACKGVAAEGSAPVGTVDKWAGSIASGTKSQTYTHGLGTTDITVAIYEKNGNEWVQILTDVDIVNANTIRVTFGANTTVEHRIVVMG